MVRDTANIGKLGQQKEKRSEQDWIETFSYRQVFSKKDVKINFRTMILFMACGKEMC